MSKTTLNLSIDETIKQRAKRIAKQKGISVSRFFENLIAEQDDPDEFIPPPGSGTAQFVNAIPESDKVDDYDYKELKKKMIEERYGNE